MIDREKTIRDLEVIGAWHTHHYNSFHYECAETIHNALELLKEQEPIAPEMLNGVIPIYWCGACGVAIDQGDIYCRKCGKPVKWND